MTGVTCLFADLDSVSDLDLLETFLCSGLVVVCVGDDSGVGHS